MYGSCAWGEEESDPGLQREEIVDRLCAAVEKSGREIYRDKERMKSGDSIDRFAREMSKAERIVAVISEKYLYSEFCMVRELFPAFRRCGYDGVEFQQKVIALVMDDAKPLLENDDSILELTDMWQKKLEVLRGKLDRMDLKGKSRMQWDRVDTMGEMCPRLPDMLGALMDIIMKRGFNEIVKDDFKDVIRLLPPLT